MALAVVSAVPTIPTVLRDRVAKKLRIGVSRLSKSSFRAGRATHLSLPPPFRPNAFTITAARLPGPGLP